ncbi:2,6-dioxo-6-phenylhexa-3-enoate hydrolase [Sphingobium chlorophenolicum L-1]|uniref:2,6-dioxo-6-phenylhexa-3-enoate hydrolase n=1 Tax=Sphingobium chlorophenolicum L-1 TaxID=690566 RepID=F6F3M1_SPHCR|nr:alpha/beta hydrolase [Sphingobium chlorophenolicum]AEG51033.1 2,6-dioxo-6-phenylhexa-3-enoate hydrolase [Sphingobium chlorophenolicum L-1]
MSDAGRGRTVQALDLDTNYHDQGTGAPVVLLHGSGPGVSAWTNWKRVIPVLADEFRVIAPDMAGFGYTERRADLAYDMKLWVKHLIGILDALGIGKASLIGNSFGGSLSLAAAARFPDRFERIVLMGTPCDKFAMTPGLRAGWDYTPSRDAMRQAMVHFPYDPAFITPELVEDRYQASLIPGAQEGLRKLLAKPAEEGETILSGIPESVVAGIEHPTLVLHGREDRVIPVEMGIRLARAMPHADLHMFGKCGHWVQAERFDPFVELARKHLRGGA